MLFAASKVVVAVASVTEFWNVTSAFGTGMVYVTLGFGVTSVMEEFASRMWTSVVPVFDSPPILNALLNQIVLPGAMAVLLKVLLDVVPERISRSTR